VEPGISKIFPDRRDTVVDQGLAVNQGTAVDQGTRRIRGTAADRGDGGGPGGRRRIGENRADGGGPGDHGARYLKELLQVRRVADGVAGVFVRGG
jgi:hypothetical protein